MMTNSYARLLPSPRLVVSVLLLLAPFASQPAQAQTRHLELNDFAKITSVSDPQISPDGKNIVFVVSRPNLEQDRSDRQLVLIDISTGTQHVLTYERKSVGSPRWSPPTMTSARPSGSTRPRADFMRSRSVPTAAQR